MNIRAFSQPNFDRKSWINSFLKGPEHEITEGSHAISLVMKLQLYVQQVNNALEETSLQVLMCLPKIQQNTRELRKEALELREKMCAVKQAITKIEDETGKSIKSIEDLDGMKSQLLIAKQGLHETDNWIALVSDLEKMFESKNVEGICDKIDGMQRSLRILVNVGDYEERKLQLECVKNRLEAVAGPAIVQAFSMENHEQSKVYVNMFSVMGRLPQLIKYYEKYQKELLINKWQRQLEFEGANFIQSIDCFYNILLSNWTTQYKWLSQHFSPEINSSKILIELYSQVLHDLKPTVNECLDAALKLSADKLALLQDFKFICDSFKRSFPKNSLEKSIYKPLILYVKNYCTFEETFLLGELNKIECIKDDLTETVQALGSSVTIVTDLANKSRKRCDLITENCGLCGLLNAFRTFFVAYADLFKVAYRQIDRRKALNGQEDWNTFQLSLQLLQYIGDVLINVQKLEKDITKSILNTNKHVTNPEFFLENYDLKSFNSLVKCVSEGTELFLLEHVRGVFAKLAFEVHQTSYQIIFAPIRIFLVVLEQSDLWKGSLENNLPLDLPEYSFTPQEYITQIGQYLMTLPQHLEPFLFADNPSLTVALCAVEQEYQQDHSEGVLADVFLKLVARGTSQSFTDKILAISHLNTSSARQLAHDINYLSNILDDLGINMSDNLTQISFLLKLPEDEYLSKSIDCSARYVSAIRHIRNIAFN